MLAKIEAIAASLSAMAELDAECEAALNSTPEPILDLDFDLLFSNPSASVPTMAFATPTLNVCGNQEISIRIPRRIIAAFKAQACRSSTGYKTLIVRTLNAASKGWKK